MGDDVYVRGGDGGGEGGREEVRMIPKGGAYSGMEWTVAKRTPSTKVEAVFSH